MNGNRRRRTGAIVVKQGIDGFLTAFFIRNVVDGGAQIDGDGTLHEQATARLLIHQLKGLTHREGQNGVVLAVVDNVHDDSFLSPGTAKQPQCQSGRCGQQQEIQEQQQRQRNKP